MNDINLLPKTEGIRLESNHAVLILRRIAFGVLFLTALIAVVVFILVFQSPLTQLKQEEEMLLQTLQQAKIPLSRTVIIQERLNSIVNILNQRTHYEEYVNTILDNSPSSITITSMSIDKNTMQVTGSTASANDAKEFFSKLVTLQKDKKVVQSVILQSFAFSGKSGEYAFVLKIIFL